MLKNISILVITAGILVSCGGSSGPASGMALLGSDFIRAFQQDRNDEPISLENVALRMTEQRESFNP